LISGGYQELRVFVARGLREAQRDVALRWLDQAEREAPRHIERIHYLANREYRLQPCLRDARPEHFLFERDRVTGIIDFGAMGMDAVACDVSRLLAEWVGEDRVSRAQAFDAYVSIRHLGEHEILLIKALDTTSALLAAGHWIRWHYVEGRAFEDSEAVHRGIVRGLERLDRLCSSPD